MKGITSSLDTTITLQQIVVNDKYKHIFIPTCFLEDIILTHKKIKEKTDTANIFHCALGFYIFGLFIPINV